MGAGGVKGTCRTRKGRRSEQNRVYHVTATTLGREPIFECLWHGRILVDLIRIQQEEGHVISLAFVVMPDHVHWLLHLTGARSLSTVINAVKSGSSRRINEHVGRRQKLWQKGFYDRAIRREEDLVGIARYIVTNPLRAGLTDSVSKFPLWDAVWV